MAPVSPILERFELKYLVDVATLPNLVEDLAVNLTPDPLGDDAGRYQIWSTYYDTADLQFYWEKLDGIKFRRKLRIRSYIASDDHHSMADQDSPVFVEIKQRLNRVTEKRRIMLPHSEAVALCNNQEVAESLKADATVAEVITLTTKNKLAPTTAVGYQRQAFVEPLDLTTPLKVRVTLDTKIMGRDQDLESLMPSRFQGPDSGDVSHDRSILSPDLAIVEIKCTSRYPDWLASFVASHGLTRVRVSKYCQSIEACELAAKSPFTHAFQ